MQTAEIMLVCMVLIRYELSQLAQQNNSAVCRVPWCALLLHNLYNCIIDFPK